MVPFRAPVADILFTLHAVAGAGGIGGHDAELAADVIGHFAAFADAGIAPLNAQGDRQGCRIENGRVRMPDGFPAAYARLAAGGWQGLTLPPAHGGQGMDHLTGAAVSEIFAGANHALQMVTGLVPGAAATLLAHGTARQQERWLPRLADGSWLTTMCLTEADAGSDLSRIRTRATRTASGWRIDGRKIFVSGGDHDLCEGILHLVLARTGSVEDGIRGLSLFLCPSEEDGLRNAVAVTRIEEKLGLHASPTCELEFDGAKADLLGTEGGGLAAMFTLMNRARLDVALQGVAHAARAHAIASHHARERRQGRRVDGGEAVLADHADVRRMLDEQRTLALGARAMCHVALVELERGACPALADVLTPLCKIFATEAGIRSADLGIQVLGGYGYLTEYGVSQVWRDVRVTAIYEGANGIHARALVTRAIRQDGGAGARAFAGLVADLGRGEPRVTDALEDWTQATERVLAAGDPAALAHDFAALSADLLHRAVWARIAVVADRQPDAQALRALGDRLLARPGPPAPGA